VQLLFQTAGFPGPKENEHPVLWDGFDGSAYRRRLENRGPARAILGGATPISPRDCADQAQNVAASVEGCRTRPGHINSGL